MRASDNDAAPLMRGAGPALRVGARLRARGARAPHAFSRLRWRTGSSRCVSHAKRPDPGAPELERADRWLRNHLDPPGASVARVVRGALAAGREPLPARRPAGRPAWRPAWLAPALVAAGVALLAAGVAWLGGDRSRPPGAGGGAAPSVAALPTISNSSGVVELRLRPAPGARPTGCSAAVFNSDGLVAAEVTGGRVRYLLVGGET